ncbi:unnamed protein product [Phytomonas sp. EM1]|nr:unnamed protein product [Phytomonas sp. EM1]|eukprot:CCW65358.1 unnamed protein product [Phytomonas sp. isolate EM1]
MATKRGSAITIPRKCKKGEPVLLGGGYLWMPLKGRMVLFAISFLVLPCQDHVIRLTVCVEAFVVVSFMRQIHLDLMNFTHIHQLTCKCICACYFFTFLFLRNACMRDFCPQ